MSTTVINIHSLFTEIDCPLIPHKSRCIQLWFRSFISTPEFHGILSVWKVTMICLQAGILEKNLLRLLNSFDSVHGKTAQKTHTIFVWSNN